MKRVPVGPAGFKRRVLFVLLLSSCFGLVSLKSCVSGSVMWAVSQQCSLRTLFVLSGVGVG